MLFGVCRFRVFSKPLFFRVARGVLQDPIFPSPSEQPPATFILNQLTTALSRQRHSKVFQTANSPEVAGARNQFPKHKGRHACTQARRHAGTQARRHAGTQPGTQARRHAARHAGTLAGTAGSCIHSARGFECLPRSAACPWDSNCSRKSVPRHKKKPRQRSCASAARKHRRVSGSGSLHEVSRGQAGGRAQIKKGIRYQRHHHHHHHRPSARVAEVK